MSAFLRTLSLTLLLSFLLSALLCAQSGPVHVSEPVVPLITPAVSDLPPYEPDPNLLGKEMHRRDDYDFSGPNLQAPPHDNPLATLQLNAHAPSEKEMRAFGTTIVNVAGYSSTSSPPDDTGDVGLNHFLQGTNQANSTVTIFSKTGVQGTSFQMQSLGGGLQNCDNGYCDPIILYDDLADRWVITEFAGTGSYFCVYVSQTGDPNGSWYAYEFPAGYSGVPDYPKYGIWPQEEDGDDDFAEGSYLIGVNAGTSSTRDVFALDRGAMLAGAPATLQKFSAPDLSAFGFQLFVPAAHTDFVFVAIGEELGLAGATGVLCLYVLILSRGYRIALRAPDAFHQLLAAGITTLLAWQALVILGGNLKLIPITGCFCSTMLTAFSGQIA